MIKPEPRRKQQKLTTSARATIAALAVLTFIGGWNLVGYRESQKAQAAAPPPVSALIAAPTPLATPWPTLAPLQPLAPIPTLSPANPIILTPIPGNRTTLEISTKGLAPIPTLAPLPALQPLAPMPTLPDLPAAPPPPPAPSGGGTRSGGS